MSGAADPAYCKKQKLKVQRLPASEKKTKPPQQNSHSKEIPQELACTPFSEQEALLLSTGQLSRDPLTRSYETKEECEIEVNEHYQHLVENRLGLYQQLYEIRKNGCERKFAECEDIHFRFVCQYPEPIVFSDPPIKTIACHPANGKYYPEAKGGTPALALRIDNCCQCVPF